MKRNLYRSMVLVLFSIFILGVPAFGDTGLYDDFSGPYIDGQKWIDRELVREVVDGKLVSKIGNHTSTLLARDNTAFQNPSSINVIQCDITVVETSLDTGTWSQSFARINGRFYNAYTADPTTHKGDVWAGVCIGDRGSGLEAWWEINECLDDAGNSWDEIDSGTLLTGLSYETAYTAKIEYDEPSQFTFTVGGANSGAVAGPARQGDEYLPFKGLGTGAYSDGGSGTGYVSAQFDDVYINNEATVYDDFSAPLDLAKWKHLEIVREISDGKLHLNVRADDSRADATLRPIDQDTAYLQTKVLVESASGVSPDTTAIVRIGGYYYNDTYGPGSYNGFEGDVWVDNRITLDEFHNLKARCLVSRVDTPVESGPATTLFYQEFTTPIAFDTEHTLSIEDTGSALIFRCNSETYQYTINTPRQDPSIGQYRQLKSRVYADSEEYGYIKAHFDDVYTGCPDQPTYDANGTWQYWLYNTWQNCPDEAPEPEMGTCTITQIGNTFTLNVDGEIDTGTICGATYTSIETYQEVDPPGTVTEAITITLSSSTTGSGTFTGRYVADDGSFSCSLGGFITLTKEPGSISGQVIVPDGPIEGLWVHAFAGPCWDNWLGGAYTDENGNYTIQNLPAGNVYVWTYAEGDHLNYVDEWYDANNGTTNCEKAAPVPVASGQNTPGIDFSLDRGPKRLSGLDVCVYNGSLGVAFDVYPGFNNQLVSATVDLARGTQYQFHLVDDRDLWDSECRYLDNWFHDFGPDLGPVQLADYGTYTLTVVFSDGAQETETFTLEEVSVIAVDESSISVTVNDDGSAHVSWNRQTTENYYYQVRVRDESNKEIYKSNSLPNASELYIPASDLRCLELGKTYRWLVRVYDVNYYRSETRETTAAYAPANLADRSSPGVQSWNGNLAFSVFVRPGSKADVKSISVSGPGANYDFVLDADWLDASTEARLGFKLWWHEDPSWSALDGDYTFTIEYDENGDGDVDRTEVIIKNLTVVPVTAVDSGTMEAVIYADGTITFSWDLPQGVTGQKYQVRVRSEDGTKEYYCSLTQEDMTTVTPTLWDLRAMERGQTYQWFVRAYDQNSSTMEGSGSLTFLYDPFPIYDPGAAVFGPDSATLTNTYMPMQLGDKLTYEGTGTFAGYGRYLKAEAVEDVDGVSCLKVLVRGEGNDPDPDQDPEWMHMWLAQDTVGNVWVLQAYLAEEDELIFLGQSDAILIMPASLTAGQIFFQRGDDYQQVQATGVTVPQLTTDLGPFTDCLKVLDIAGGRDLLYMAPGIGTVKEEWDIEWETKGWELLSLETGVAVLTIEDDFNDGILNSVLWTSFGNENRYAIETNGRLEIRANSLEDDAGGVQLLGRLISVNEDFRVQVDFNSSECSLNSGIVLAVHNATTDMGSFNDYIIIANGHDADIVEGRSWVAAKSINDEFVEITTEPTATTSGTLYIEHMGDLFYVSFTGYGANNAFATFTTNGWTSCSEVFITLAGFTRNKALSGEGSYLDNFHLDIGIAEPATISGQVSYAGTAGGTYYIGLFPSSAGEDLINQEAIKGVASADGSYTLSDLQPGSYFVAAYRDTDGDQEPNKDEPLGFYTGTTDPADQNGLPLAIVLGGGETETINFTIYDWPYFTEIDVDRSTFPPTGWPLGLSDEMLWAGIEVGYRPGVAGNVTVTVSGPGITDPDEVELKDDGILPDEVAGDGKYTGWVDTGGTVAGDPESYTFKLTANSLIVDEDMSVQGSALPLPTIVRPGAFVTDPQPITFEWNFVPGAQHYDLFILDSANPTTMSNILFIKEEILDTQYALTTQDLALTEGGTYYWFVGAYDDLDDNISNSEYRSFTVDTTKPMLASLTLAPLSPVKAGLVTFTITFSGNMDQAVAPTVTFGTPAKAVAGDYISATVWQGGYTIETGYDGEQTISVSGAKDPAGNEMVEDTSHTFVVDTTAPITTPDLPEGTYGTAQQVELSVVEVNPDKTYYALLTTDPGPSPAQPTTVYTTAINLPESGEVVDYYLVYYSVDLAGNEEGVKVAHYTIDARVPVTNFSFSPTPNEYNNAYYGRALVLTLSSSNNTIYYEGILYLMTPQPAPPPFPVQVILVYRVALEQKLITW